MMHNHHILPRKAPYLEDLHKFRLDEEWQVSLTLEGHACQHDILYRVFKWDGDRIARDCLSGSVGKDELLKATCSLGGKMSAAKMNAHPNTKKNRSEIGKKVGKVTVKLMNSHPNTVEGRIKGGKNIKPEDRVKAGRKGGLIGGSKGGIIGGNKNSDLQQATRRNNINQLNSQKWISTVDGYISTSAGVAHHNKSIGADPSLKRRVDGI